MFRIFTALLSLLLILSLSACAHGAKETMAATLPPQTVTTEVTIAQSEPVHTTIPVQTVPVTVPQETEAVTVPTQPPHTDLFIPGVSVEDVILYFNEVCLQAEIVNSGNPTKLQKWVSPIYYTLEGNFTEEDHQTLYWFTEFLNSIPGFPGIHESRSADTTNLTIHFCDQQTLVILMGDHFQGADGAVTFWYTDDMIYEAIICYRTDVDQQVRNSVILEEIYNGLGPIQDTELRTDSIIYSEFSQPQELSQMDALILRLLYHPEMECGMDAAQCETVIRRLYH